MQGKVVRPTALTLTEVDAPRTWVLEKSTPGDLIRWRQKSPVLLVLGSHSVRLGIYKFAVPPLGIHDA